MDYLLKGLWVMPDSSSSIMDKLHTGTHPAEIPGAFQIGFPNAVEEYKASNETVKAEQQKPMKDELGVPETVNIAGTDMNTWQLIGGVTGTITVIAIVIYIITRD